MHRAVKAGVALLSERVVTAARRYPWAELCAGVVRPAGVVASALAAVRWSWEWDWAASTRAREWRRGELDGGNGRFDVGSGFRRRRCLRGFSSAGNGVMGVLGATSTAGGLAGVDLSLVESLVGCGFSASRLSGANQSSGSISQSSLAAGADAVVASLGRLAMRSGTGYRIVGTSAGGGAFGTRSAVWRYGGRIASTFSGELTTVFRSTTAAIGHWP